MAYSRDPKNLLAAARRHREAADALFDDREPTGGKHRAVCGYLYGIAAECAVKAMMHAAGLRPLDPSERRDDPFFAHFPNLRTLLRDQQPPRRSRALSTLIDDDQFMSQWDTAMRYAPGSEVKPEWVQRWRDQARSAVDSMGT